MRPGTLLTLGLACTAACPAQAETLIQLIYEKRVAGDPRTGLIPINQLVLTPPEPLPVAAAIPPTLEDSSESASRAPLWLVRGPLRKHYRIGGPFQSEVWVDASGKTIRRIAVARQASQMLMFNHRLYVLCGGYLASVWEIDPSTDLVVRRFGVAAGATGLAVDRGNLVVKGPTTQRIDLASGSVKSAPVSPGKPDWTLEAPAAPRPPAGDLLLVGHKNQDYLQVVDPQAGVIRALIALDAPVDDLYVRRDRRYAYAWHRSLGQVSVIDLTGGAGHLTLAGRWQDQTLNGQNLSLVESASGVHLWLNGVVATLGTHGLSRTAFSGDIRHPKERMVLDRERAQQWYVRQGRLWREALPALGETAPPQPQALPVGEAIDSMVVSWPTRQVVATDATGHRVWLVSLDNPSHQESVAVGEQPLDVVLSQNGREAYVLHAGEGSVARLDLKRRELFETVPLLGAEPLSLRLWDNQYRQEIRIRMPVYTHHAYFMRPL